MAPVAHSDIEAGSHTSDMASQDSPIRRQFSEPIHRPQPPPHLPPQPSPNPIEHMASVHPQIARRATLDGAADEPVEADRVSTVAEIEENDAADVEDEQDDDLSEAAVDGVADGAETTEPTNPPDEDEELEAEPEADADGDTEAVDGDGHEVESDLALSNQLHEFSQPQDSVSLDKRVQNLWNLHEATLFSSDYDETATHLNQTWAHVFLDPLDPKRGKKRDGSDLLDRPDPYKKPHVGRGDFLEITQVEAFLRQLRDPELRASDQLYAITENVAYALQAWQDEYLAIEKLQKLATRHNAKPSSNPRKTEKPRIFEDKKEAMLYNYKHDPKKDKINHQNPFVQGGFKPTLAQARKMAAKVGPDNPNPDGWPTITKFGVEHVPKFQNPPPRVPVVPKATRKRKAAELEAARARDTDQTPGGTPAPADTEPESIPPKRTTRARRTDPAPTTRPAARGRGRGKGARTGARAASETPQPATPTAPARASGRMPGRETAAPATAAGTSQTRPGLATSLAPLEPAPRAGSVTTAAEIGDGGLDPLDPAEIARREKIANSKNPKRTEAMLNHWARFNREGRTRNPKRSKAQIEADRVAEAAKRATEPDKLVVNNQPTESPPYGGPPPLRTDAGLAPAPPPPMAASAPLAPGLPGAPRAWLPLRRPGGPGDRKHGPLRPH
ncbi:hypothetical protein P168DRAFT_297190 [Aspergillus campestris IBT 28561]|uniref:Uncharacterized protein n=1 Tax=Aspergillus campestris (strain IBT 28561) TaxID=1392248 RepID=A0A2I1D336_ASPC2|nr:uncharacterized protein P168DRAFT_297190 [Aspergillus campestris IBT 28561]PKY04296.1 hypothetical protein P168DRAFT_297190 [Aspergillus campestris IBT 28561]